MAWLGLARHRQGVTVYRQDIGEAKDAESGMA